jgi:flagellar hook assembly protein FlgD
VRILVEGELEAGTYEETWDGRDDEGHNAASGVYFARLQAGAFTQARAMALVR